MSQFVSSENTNLSAVLQVQRIRLSTLKVVSSDVFVCGGDEFISGSDVVDGADQCKVLSDRGF